LRDPVSPLLEVLTPGPRCLDIGACPRRPGRWQEVLEGREPFAGVLVVDAEAAHSAALDDRAEGLPVILLAPSSPECRVEAEPEVPTRVFFVGKPAIPALAQAVAVVFLAGMAAAGVFLFPNILTADIVDYDATRTETRREAMFYGTQNMVEKAATALSPLIFATVLLAGDSTDHPLGIRLVGPIAGLLVLVAFISFRRYSLAPEAADAAR
jgi:hypothetical protein